MIPLLAPVLSMLASNGLNLIAGAIEAKGKEVVENALGVKIPEKEGDFTPELLQELRMKEMEHEEALQEIQLRAMEANFEHDAKGNEAVTERWEADMVSDSWLSKNIRPLVLVFLIGAVTLFGLLSAFGKNMDAAYVDLFKVWGGLALSAYFVGRSHEKGVHIKHKHFSKGEK